MYPSLLFGLAVCQKEHLLFQLGFHKLSVTFKIKPFHIQKRLLLKNSIPFN